jgi:hypothetical protein
VLVCAAGAAAQAPAPNSTAEAALLAVEDGLFAADVHHDTAAIQRGFADEAIFVHANGKTQTVALYAVPSFMGIIVFWLKIGGFSADHLG